jgi:hypothetical protein
MPELVPSGAALRPWIVDKIAEHGLSLGPPHYGLAPLNDAQDEEGEPNPDIARPQPLTEPWLWEDEPDAPGELIEAAWGHGRIWLGTDGCGTQWVLVVAGECAGEVFVVCGEGAGPTEPRQDFLEWYASWLAER